VIDLARGTQHTLAGAKRASPAAFFGSVAWSPNGRWIDTTRSPELYGAEIDVLDARSGRLIDAFHVAARADGGLSWSTDGADLYFARQSGGRVRPTLRRLVAATGRTVSLGVVGLDPQIDSDGVIAFTAPDGVRLLGQRKYRGSRAGDRLAAWTSDALLVERPAGAGCPREIHPVCSHVLRLVLDAAPRLLLRTPARNPAAR